MSYNVNGFFKAGLTNRQTEDIGALSSNGTYRREAIAYCTSPHCLREAFEPFLKHKNECNECKKATNSKTFCFYGRAIYDNCPSSRIRKSTTRNADLCPSCGNALIWKIEK